MEIKYKNFEDVLHNDPEYLYNILSDHYGDFCLIRIEKNQEWAYVYDILPGRGVEKECNIMVRIDKLYPGYHKPGWYIGRYIRMDFGAYTIDEPKIHLRTAYVVPIKYLKDIWICDDKSPMGIFLCICLKKFTGGYLQSVENTPLKNVDIDKLIRSCSRFNRQIKSTCIEELTAEERVIMISLFLKEDINIDLISAWLDPYHTGRR